MWWWLVQAAVAGPWHVGASVGGGVEFQIAWDGAPGGLAEASLEVERELPMASLYLSIPVRVAFKDGDPAVLSGLHIGAVARVDKRPLRRLIGGGGGVLAGAFPAGGTPAVRAFAEGRFGLEVQPDKGPAWQLWAQPEIGVAATVYELAPMAQLENGAAYNYEVAPCVSLQVRTGIRF